jgi:quinol monooxygenase YgiN
MRGLAWNKTIGRVSYTIVQRPDLVISSQCQTGGVNMPALKLFAHGKSKPGHEKELRALVQELLSAGRREQAEFGDVEVYEAYETETPGEFIFHEEYATQAAFDRHSHLPDHLKIVAQLPEHLADGYTVWKVASVGARD